MLVLTRKLKESIIIDNKIEVKILEVRGDQVRIGINAPRDVKIYRSEVWDSIREASKASSDVTDSELAEISLKFKKK